MLMDSIPTLPPRTTSIPVSYTHLDVYKRQKKDSFARSLFLYEKENIEIVLAGVQLEKKCIDFRAMSDKILTRKSKRIDFQEGK